MHPDSIEIHPALTETDSTALAIPCVFAEKFALIIPTLHESGNISTLLQRVRQVLDSLSIGYEVIIVDDNSQDGIAEIIEAIAQSDPRIRLMIRKEERGLAGAILHGWQSTDATIVGAIDADLQHPPELLSLMMDELMAGSDLVIASRYAVGGSLNRWNLCRSLLSGVAAFASVPLQRSDFRTTDPMSGFFILRRSCIHGLTLQKTGFKILLEILVRGHFSSISEIPFSFGHRESGQSKASIKVALDYFKLLLRLYRIRLAEKLKREKSVSLMQLDS